MLATPKVSLTDVISAKRAHLARFANQNGADGEASALVEMAHWMPRPKGKALKVLLTALHDTGVIIKPTSFDAIALPPAIQIDFLQPAEVSLALASMCFIEIKSANQKRVKPGFDGFFFALTETEISAANQLQNRYKVALYNKITREVLLTSVAEILGRAKSTTWQVSLQL